jgi:CubicO group peptidase (beta-lactamase class C family)
VFTLLGHALSIIARIAPEYEDAAPAADGPVRDVATAGPPALSEGGRAALSDFLRASVARGNAPAVAAIIVNRDAVLFLDAAGKRDVAGHAEMAPDTIFRIASINTHFWVNPEKGIGAVVLMRVLPYYDERCLAVLRGFEKMAYQQLR